MIWREVSPALRALGVGSALGLLAALAVAAPGYVAGIPTSAAEPIGLGLLAATINPPYGVSAAAPECRWRSQALAQGEPSR